MASAPGEGERTWRSTVRTSSGDAFLRVPAPGVEPGWGCPRGILSPLRLPIPPRRRTAGWRLAPGTATALFVAYAALNGVTLSFVLLAYTGQSVTNAFVVTAGMFGAMALFGSMTKRNLAGVGQFAFMGLIGLVLASLVGLFWHNNALQFVISTVGVIVFTGLTAWDAQRLKQMALATPEGQARSFAIVGALALYLDFINLFLSLLTLFGNRRE